jgi:hypothetical protein
MWKKNIKMDLKEADFEIRSQYFEYKIPPFYIMASVF